MLVDFGCSATSSRDYETFGCFRKIPQCLCMPFHKGIDPLHFFNVNALRCMENAFISNAFSCFKKKCGLSHEHIRLGWYANMHDYVECLVFEAHLPMSANSHLNATCIDPTTHARSFVTRELFDINHVRGEG